MNKNISNERKNCIQKYTEYVYNHKKIIYDIWEQNKNLFIKELNLSNKEINDINTNIINHDISKLEDEDFEIYRKYLFPTEEEALNIKDNLIMYRKARYRHYHSHKHHWQMHCDDPGHYSAPMDNIYIVEMLCDWTATGIVEGNTVEQYYKLHEDDIILHKNTKDLLKALIPLITTI